MLVKSNEIILVLVIRFFFLCPLILPFNTVSSCQPCHSTAWAMRHKGRDCWFNARSEIKSLTKGTKNTGVARVKPMLQSMCERVYGAYDVYERVRTHKCSTSLCLASHYLQNGGSFWIMNPY